MSNQHVIRSQAGSPVSGQDFVVPRPSAARTVGGALNHAFDLDDAGAQSLPEDWIALLNRIEAKTDHFDGE